MWEIAKCGQVCTVIRVHIILHHHGSFDGIGFYAWATLTILAHRRWRELSVVLRGSFHQRSHQTDWDCVKLKSLRGRAWMIYAFVISHLLKQGVNVFVPSHQSSLQRQRGKDEANVLEERKQSQLGSLSKARLVFLSALSWRCNGGRQSPCDSFVSSLCTCSLSKWEKIKWNRYFNWNYINSFWKYPPMAEALIPFDEEHLQHLDEIVEWILLFAHFYPT